VRIGTLVALLRAMATQTGIQNNLRGRFFILAVAALITGCGSSTTTPSSSAGTATTTTNATTTTSTPSTLAISPSSISLVEGGSYTFSASGGSGSGYTFSLASGGSVSGTVSSSGYFLASSSWTGTTFIILTDSAGNETYSTVTITSNSSGSTGTSSLSISPSTITLDENQSYTFAASGGSGSGYVYSVPSGSYGSVNSSTGVYLSPSAWTGTTMLEVTDSENNIAFATITVASSSGGTTSPTLNITGSLLNCAGVAGGSKNINNWQVNGSELRSINDANNSTESPVYCTGLSIAGDIPSTATIQGISVSIFLINQSSNTDGSLLQSMNLMYGGSLLGSAKTLGLSIPGISSSFPTFIEGGTADEWSAYITPAILNSASFGIDIQTYRGKDRLFIGDSSSVLPQVTIYYTE
jgi:hypothetical protein